MTGKEKLFEKFGTVAFDVECVPPLQDGSKNKILDLRFFLRGCKLVDVSHAVCSGHDQE